MNPAELAALHRRCFTHPRPWNVAEFAAFQDDPHVFVICADQRGFVMGRVVLDEAELLTLATDPEHRRQGIGQGLLAQFSAMAIERGAKQAFLEVAHDNHGARALYGAAGWLESGCRPGYYGPGQDALILSWVMPKTKIRVDQQVRFGP